MVGQRKLHPNVVIVCLGNKATDRAITNSLSTAMQSRLVHLELEASFTEWLEDIAIPQKYDPRIIAYLSMVNKNLMDFRPDHQDKTFCCPRTWQFANELIKNVVELDWLLPALAGTITSGVACELVQFSKISTDLVTVDAIKKDPSNCKLPSETASKWLVITHLIESTTEDTLSTLRQYVDRFDISFRILYYRSVLIHHKELKHHKHMLSAMSDLAKYLYN